MKQPSLLTSYCKWNKVYNNDLEYNKGRTQTQTRVQNHVFNHYTLLPLVSLCSYLKEKDDIRIVAFSQISFTPYHLPHHSQVSLK